MFDVGKSKFYKKSKQLLKLLKTRIDTIRKKRNAVHKYFNNDIAELLRSGLDVNAYGRAEGLLVELKMSSCYDFIEQCIMCISGQLSAMDNQRECPSECREAVPSLMHAAARFSDLPELRDLRTVFSDRYGTSLEPFINKEFVEKLRSGHPTKEKKLQLMQEIAQENSIQWDPMSLEQKMFKPLPPVQDKPKHGSSHGSEDNRVNRHKRMDDALPARDGHDGGNKMNVMTENVVPKRIEKGFAYHGRKAVLDDRYNVPIISDDEVVSSNRRDSTSRDSQQTSSSSIGSFSEDEVDSRNPFYYRYIPPPYVEQNAGKEGRTIEDTTESNGFVNAKQNNLQYPPVNKDNSQPSSPRKSTLRPPPGREIVENEIVDNLIEKAEKARQRLQSILKDYDDDQSDEEEKKLDKLLMLYGKKKPPNSYPPPGHERDDTSRATRHSARANLYPMPGKDFDDYIEHTRRRNGRANLHTPSAHEKDNYSEATKHINARVNLYLPPGQESDDANGAARARHRSGRANLNHPPGQQYDETSRARRHRNARSELSHPPARESSIPLEQTAAQEAIEGHARTMSLQPDMLTCPGHVHPKLPDYDDLAARLAALRGQ